MFEYSMGLDPLNDGGIETLNCEVLGQVLQCRKDTLQYLGISITPLQYGMADFSTLGEAIIDKSLTRFALFPQLRSLEFLIAILFSTQELPQPPHTNSNSDTSLYPPNLTSLVLTDALLPWNTRDEISELRNPIISNVLYLLETKSSGVLSELKLIMLPENVSWDCDIKAKDTFARTCDALDVNCNPLLAQFKPLAYVSHADDPFASDLFDPCHASVVGFMNYMQQPIGLMTRYTSFSLLSKLALTYLQFSVFTSVLCQASDDPHVGWKR